jgi:hypothetical protein
VVATSVRPSDRDQAPATNPLADFHESGRGSSEKSLSSKHDFLEIRLIDGHTLRRI